MMWKLEREEQYFRIFDSRKDVAGYFDPDYGDIRPKDREHEIIERMLESRDTVRGGYVMVGLAKFGIFGGSYNSDLPGLESRLAAVSERISVWKDLISEQDIAEHFVNISHTDHDMLTIAFPVRFSRPVRLDGREIGGQIGPMLDLLQRRRLL